MKETFGISGGGGGVIFIHKNGNSGEMGGLSWNSLRGGGMDIFWNYTSTNLSRITCDVCLLLCALNFLLQWPPVQNIFLGFSFPLRKLHVNGFALITMNSFFNYFQGG